MLSFLTLVTGIVCLCSRTLIDDFSGTGNWNSLGLWTSDDNSMQSVQKLPNELILKASSPASYFYSLVECRDKDHETITLTLQLPKNADMRVGVFYYQNGCGGPTESIFRFATEYANQVSSAVQTIRIPIDRSRRIKNIEFSGFTHSLAEVFLTEPVSSGSNCIGVFNTMSP
jgi:hypothetical protein